MVRLSGTACPLNCGKQNHLNLFEMVVAISSTESIKRIYVKQNFFIFSIFTIYILDHVYID